MHLQRSLISPAAIGAAGDKQEPRKLASCDKARFETPWQDRRTLLLPASFGLSATASRRLAHGFRGMPKTMRERNNVRYASS
jgi:hypothetical protein